MNQTSTLIDASGTGGSEKMPYEAPTIVRYGTVAGLTASGLKCTPGTDAALATTYVEDGPGTWVNANDPTDTIPMGQEPTWCQPSSTFFP